MSDPRFITAKFSGTCGKCGGHIAKGSRAWFNPNTRTGKRTLCDRDLCGRQAQREFASAVQDEEVYAGGRPVSAWW